MSFGATIILVTLMSVGFAEDTPIRGERDIRTLVVSSGRCPGLSEVEAQAEAEKVLNRKMAEALQDLAREWAGIRLSTSQALLEWAWLLGQPGVNQEVKRSCVLKEYGWVAEQETRLSLPNDVLGQWTGRLKQQAAVRWQVRLAGGLASLVLFISGLIGMVVLDRWTKGYHRGLVVGGLSLGMAIVLIAIWVWILMAW